MLIDDDITFVMWPMCIIQTRNHFCWCQQKLKKWCQQIHSFSQGVKFQVNTTAGSWFFYSENWMNSLGPEKHFSIATIYLFTVFVWKKDVKSHEIITFCRVRFGLIDLNLLELGDLKIEKKNTRLCWAIPLREWLAVTLLYLASGQIQQLLP